MSTFPNLPPDADSPLDARLRDAFDLFGDPAADLPPPPPGLWAGVAAGLRPVPPPVAAPARRAHLLSGVAGLLLGLLLMWGWGGGRAPQSAVTRANLPTGPRSSSGTPANLPTGTQSTSGTPANLPTGTQSTSGTPANLPTGTQSTSGTPANLPTGTQSTSGTPANLPTGTRSTSGTPANLPTGLPTAGGVLDSDSVRPSGAAPAVLLPLMQAETVYATVPAADSSAETRATRRRALLSTRAALVALTHRTDSLLLTLGVLPVKPALPEAPPALAAIADSLLPANPPTRQPFKKWSIALAFAPERNFFGLSAPAADTLSALRRTHEQGRAGFNANLLAEYRLDQRLSVAAGLGMASYGAELRLTELRTNITTRLDSTTTTSVRLDSVTTRAYIIRVVQDSVLSPILDFNNQVIGYNYTMITRRDTVWTRLTNSQLTTLTTKTYTPTVTTRQEQIARILRPNYRFLTLPVLVRYRLGRAHDWTSNPAAPRWWADVAVGAQLQFFLGGTQATTTDGGRTYHTERVGPRGGPFRPLNVALTGAVAFNYALTPRLSASLAPTLRWQVESVYKPSTNLTQRPTATGLQLGVKYAF